METSTDLTANRRRRRLSDSGATGRSGRGRLMVITAFSAAIVAWLAFAQVMAMYEP
ncbi:MAG: hypothetical protein O7G86_10530 [Gammaproteobacteria bacterium]|nr:hypothetical protein [Gammaproteobacteria bacterium]MCZ6854344.1 hypothetical protein [Gammaproteobacteria bacterium]